MDLDVNALQVLADEEQVGLSDCYFTDSCLRSNNDTITIQTPLGSYTF
ncbi:hypothetical protein [Streptomyces sp. NPDC001250]